MKNVIGITGKIKTGLVAVLLVTGGSAAFTASTAEAAVSPNYNKYCQKYHRGSFVNSMRSNGAPLCTLRTQNSMTHYRININTACRLAGGTGAYNRVAFGRYQCTTRRVVRNNRNFNKSRNARFRGTVQPNVSGYCQRYHRGSFANYFRATGAPACTLKIHYSMKHYRVNLNTACRLAGGNGTYYRVAYRNYQCNR